MLRSLLSLFTIAIVLICGADAFAPSSPYNGVQRQTVTSLNAANKKEASEQAAKQARINKLQEVDGGVLFKATAYLGASVVAMGLILAPGLVDLNLDFAQAITTSSAPKVEKVGKASDSAAKKVVKKNIIGRKAKIKDPAGYNLGL